MDLDALSAWLSTLGPWGMLAAFGVGLFGPKLLAAIKDRLPKLPAVPAPKAPDAAPADGRPLSLLLNVLLDAVRRRQPDAKAEDLVAEVLAREIYCGFIQPAK